MMRWTINTNNCDLIGDYYFEKGWHTPENPKYTLPNADSAVKIFNGSKELNINYNYAIVPFVKAFVSSKIANEINNIESEGYRLPAWTKIAGRNGLMYAPSEITLPSDEELGKNLIAGLNSGSWSLSNTNKVWNDYPNNGYPYGISKNQYRDDPILQHSIGDHYSATDLGTDMSVVFDENAAPDIRNNSSYQAPGLFTPIAFGDGASYNNLMCGIVIVLGVKAVEV